MRTDTDDPAILMLAKAYPPAVGGVETYSEHLSREYVRAGYRVIVVTQCPGKAGWEFRPYPEGVVEVHNVGDGSQPISFVKMLLAVARLRAVHNFDFVHATTWRPALAIWPWRRWFRLVVTVHGREVLLYPFYLRRPLLSVLNGANVVACVSDATLGAARRALGEATPTGRWIVNFNGLSYAERTARHSRASRDPASPVRLLSFARLVERKNIQGCLRALAILRANGISDFHYSIAGRGPMQDELRQLSTSLSLDDVVSFLGYVEDAAIPELYENADIFLHPQIAASEGDDMEGFGLVIADAMSFGCAVIAGRDGGPADFVKNGERGLIVDGTDTEALAEAISSLLADGPFRARLGADAKRWSLSELDWRKHVERILVAVSTS